MIHYKCIYNVSKFKRYLQKKGNLEMKNINTWMTANKLTVNKQKT